MSDFNAEAASADVIDPIAEVDAAEAHSAAAEPDQPAAPAESVHDYLMSQLLDGADEEGSGDPEPPATPEVEPAEETSAQDTEEQEPLKDPADDSSKTEKTDSPSPALTVVGREEIEKQFQRAPKEIREVAAKNAEAFLALQTQIETDFGGEHMAEPMKMIAKGLLEDDNRPVIHGVIAAQGVEGFTGLMRDFLQVALIDAPQNSDRSDEGQRYFAEACEAVTAELLQARFGEGASPALIEKLVKYHSEGLIDTSDIDTYYEEHGDGKAATSPLLKEKEEEIAELRRKLEESQATETDAKAGDETRFAAQWTTEIFEESNKSLEDLYFKHSVLKPVKGDTAEMRAGKEHFKTMLLDTVKQLQQADPTFKKLQAAAYRGNSGTAKFKLEKSKLVENTVFQAKKLAAPIEALISQVYTLGRNANIPRQPQRAASAGSSNPSFEPAAPTQTTPAERGNMTLEQWQDHVRTELAKG